MSENQEIKPIDEMEFSELEAEILKLRGFIEETFRHVWEYSSDHEGIQEAGISMGILEARAVDPERNEFGAAELYFPYWAPEDTEGGS